MDSAIEWVWTCSLPGLQRRHLNPPSRPLSTCTLESDIEKALVDLVGCKGDGGRRDDGEQPRREAPEEPWDAFLPIDDGRGPEQAARTLPRRERGRRALPSLGGDGVGRGDDAGGGPGRRVQLAVDEAVGLDARLDPVQRDGEHGGGDAGPRARGQVVDRPERGHLVRREARKQDLGLRVLGQLVGGEVGGREGDIAQQRDREAAPQAVAQAFVCKDLAERVQRACIKSPERDGNGVGRDRNGVGWGSQRVRGGVGASANAAARLTLVHAFMCMIYVLLRVILIPL